MKSKVVKSKGLRSHSHSHNHHDQNQHQNLMLTVLGGESGSGGDGDDDDNDNSVTVTDKNIIPNILQLCHKAHDIIKFLTVDDLCKKERVLAWIADAYEKICSNVVTDDFLQLFHGFGVKITRPSQQEQVSICGVNGDGIIAMICNLIMWSSYNEDCNAIIVECLESRLKQQQRAFANAHPEHSPKNILVWIAALVVSVQATVNYACKKVYSDSKLKKIECDVDDALILNEPTLIEACYLSYAVASSFSPAFSSFIDKDSKMKDCGGIDAISFVKMFVKYLGSVKPDVPTKKALTQIFHFTKMDKKSKMCIALFLTTYRNNFQNHQQKKQQAAAAALLLLQCDNEQILNNLKLRFPQLLEMLKLKEIKALRKVVEVKRLQGQGKGKETELQQVEEAANAALRSLGSDGMPRSESDKNFFATCLTILTMFVHELMGPSRISNGDCKDKEKGAGRKILLKFLVTAFEGASKSNNEKKGIRSNIKNALWKLIMGDPPLFSILFVREVIEGSFSIPTDHIWKAHFPAAFNKVASTPTPNPTGRTLRKQKINKNTLTQAQVEENVEGGKVAGAGGHWTGTSLSVKKQNEHLKLASVGKLKSDKKGGSKGKAKDRRGRKLQENESCHKKGKAGDTKIKELLLNKGETDQNKKLSKDTMKEKNEQKRKRKRGDGKQKYGIKNPLKLKSESESGWAVTASGVPDTKEKPPSHHSHSSAIRKKMASSSELVAFVTNTKTMSPTSTSRDKDGVLGMKTKEGKKRKHPQMSRGEPTLMPDPDTVSAVPVETKTALRRSPRKQLELEDNVQKQMRGKEEKQSEYDLIIHV